MNSMNSVNSDMYKNTIVCFDGKDNNIYLIVGNVAHNLCCQIRVDDNFYDCINCNNRIVLACFNCTLHIYKFWSEYRGLKVNNRVNILFCDFITWL